ncbi:cytochrome-c oxidase, cbb3-type subunit I [Acanthopleuribacter pedis]|uniref:cytochrome-c oxidase n=1 Tax=Acanthopleuribacter pedis TaxID=442870 RepID=A0A8J7QE07_9BACT|nr:cytochrome-c oxidase, cbb3-type subunit I [Acanthopleuribacter pedis]MBO1317900.1 cytochrome-c oxidase, cbb3-type subunit I [Acanthopleuribacter pedis]
MTVERFRYDDDIVRKFVWATVIWGLVGMLVGVLIAFQLAFWKANLGIPYLTFGRLRPLHTNAVIFAFAGNSFFAGMYYASQRLLKTRMFSDKLSRIHFWGWQLIIVAAAITLPLGITTSKEYAELEWPIDLAITAVWVVMAINYFGTIFKRRERHLYVAIWFFIASIVTVAVLHIFNSLELPVSMTKSYSVYAGVQDALVQWWYGHNAVAFFLTTPFLGLMYYFMPKAAEGPIYSYRLSIIHFWSLIFLYIWAGPHHLLFTSLPDWAQTMGMLFSLMLIAPSWGGMINGLLTLRGAWHKLREDPILKFMVVAITFYGMSTFEGPMLSIKSLNKLSHYTDWTISHVHGGALGWNGFLTYGMIYWLIPRLYGRELYSKKLATAHFWMGLLGILIYMLSMYIAGVTQGLMWLDFDNEGYLKYPNFVETVIAIVPLYWIRMFGGMLYLGGALVMLYNVVKTISGVTVPEDTEAEATPYERKPLVGSFHYRLEAKPVLLTVLATIAILIGGVAETIPMMAIESNVPSISSVKPYTPLELVGRDIYIREGCNNCHSQMIRPLRAEVERYGEYSKSGEFVYDHPHLWGSKRTGPDLHRVGGKYPNLWHLRHMEDPRAIVADSIMPAYQWLLENKMNLGDVKAKVNAMKHLGVPYDRDTVENAKKIAEAQAAEIGADLAASGVEGMDDKEITALIAYLQRLGTDIKK